MEMGDEWKRVVVRMGIWGLLAFHEAVDDRVGCEAAEEKWVDEVTDSGRASSGGLTYAGMEQELVVFGAAPKEDAESSAVTL